MSEMIEVRSILGRFLEHSRIFRFANGGDPVHFIGSGDWMTRNLRERVEVIVPVSDPELKARLDEILRVYWEDTAKALVMYPGGGFARVAPRDGGARFEAQAWLMEHPESLPAEEAEGRPPVPGAVALPGAEGLPEKSAKAYIGS